MKYRDGPAVKVHVSVIHTAAKLVWPKINIKGCRFHLGQNWWKKIQALGLVNTYNSLNTEKNFFWFAIFKTRRSW